MDYNDENFISSSSLFNDPIPSSKRDDAIKTLAEEYKKLFEHVSALHKVVETLLGDSALLKSNNTVHRELISTLLYSVINILGIDKESFRLDFKEANGYDIDDDLINNLFDEDKDE